MIDEQHLEFEKLLGFDIDKFKEKVKNNRDWVEDVIEIQITPDSNNGNLKVAFNNGDRVSIYIQYFKDISFYFRPNIDDINDVRFDTITNNKKSLSSQIIFDNFSICNIQKQKLATHPEGRDNTARMVCFDENKRNLINYDSGKAIANMYWEFIPKDDSVKKSAVINQFGDELTCDVIMPHIDKKTGLALKMLRIDIDKKCGV